MDVEAFDQAWDVAWGERARARNDWKVPDDRWVRFWSLPGGKQYPTRPAHWAELLRRHRVVLAELVGGQHRPLVVVTSAWSTSAVPGAQQDWIPAAFERAAPWRSELIDGDGDDWWEHTYLSDATLSDPKLWALIRKVAVEEVVGVMIAPPDAAWRYDPYAGGADVHLPTVEAKRELSDRHPAWGSPDRPWWLRPERM